MEVELRNGIKMKEVKGLKPFPIVLKSINAVPKHTRSKRWQIFFFFFFSECICKYSFFFFFFYCFWLFLGDSDYEERKMGDNLVSSPKSNQNPKMVWFCVTLHFMVVYYIMQKLLKFLCVCSMCIIYGVFMVYRTVELLRAKNVKLMGKCGPEPRSKTPWTKRY